MLPKISMPNTTVSVIIDSRLGTCTMTICSTINPDLYIHVSWYINGRDGYINETIMDDTVVTLRKMMTVNL